MPPVWLQTFIRRFWTMYVLFNSLGIAFVIYVQDHDIVNMLYLVYPVLLYLVLFGFVGEPFLEYQCSSFDNTNASTLATPPEKVRLEVETLRRDFNTRLKQVLFNTLVSTYYATFLPCCFAPNALNYETL